MDSEMEFERWLREVIEEGLEVVQEEGVRIRSFREAELLTRNHGLVIRWPGGAEFQVTILKSK
jgi:hypothetical protein